MATDLLSAMVQRSKQVADPLASAYASGNRPFTVRLSRPHTTIAFSRDEWRQTNPDDEVLYEGPGRVYTASGGVELDLGDERTTFTNARCSIDHYAGSPPRVDDLLEVLSTPQSTQTHLAGRTFTVGDVEVGGHFGIGYSLTLTGVAPSRRTPGGLPPLVMPDEDPAP